MADELETCAFAKLGELRVVRCLGFAFRWPVPRTGIRFAVFVLVACVWVLAVVGGYEMGMLGIGAAFFREVQPRAVQPAFLSRAQFSVHTG